MHSHVGFYYWSGVIAWWILWAVFAWKATDWVKDRWGEAIAKFWIYSWIGQAWEAVRIWHRFVIKKKEMTDDLEKLEWVRAMYENGARKKFIWRKLYIRLLDARIAEINKRINDYFNDVGECNPANDKPGMEGSSGITERDWNND